MQATEYVIEAMAREACSAYEPGGALNQEHVSDTGSPSEHSTGEQHRQDGSTEAAAAAFNSQTSNQTDQHGSGALRQPEVSAENMVSSDVVRASGEDASGSSTHRQHNQHINAEQHPAKFEGLQDGNGNYSAQADGADQRATRSAGLHSESGSHGHQHPVDATRQRQQHKNAADASMADKAARAKRKQQDKPPGRNRSCPCGSHKKYKNCCGAAKAAAVRRQADAEQYAAKQGSTALAHQLETLYV